MSHTHWSAVDHYFTDLLIPPDSVLESALAASEAAGMPAHQVSPLQGKLLLILAQMMGARRILEIGTLGGYSTIWLARALPADGQLVTFECNVEHAAIAATNLERAKLSDRVEMRVGPALESLAQLATEGCEPFDFIFIDADKPNNPFYLDWALRLSRRGTVIIADNVVRDGHVIDESSTDPNVCGIRRFTELIAADPRLTATAIQTVGSKGYDGFAIARVNRD